MKIKVKALHQNFIFEKNKYVNLTIKLNIEEKLEIKHVLIYCGVNKLIKFKGINATNLIKGYNND